MNKFGGVIERMNMKLGSKFLNSLTIKTQLLKRLQRVFVVDGTIQFQVEGNGGGSLGDRDFVLFLHSAQLGL
jgi:hypothetical protein